MNKAKLFSLTALTIMYPLVVVSILSSAAKDTNGGIATCAHEGYHYEENEATPYMQGNKEFWRCCKCHGLYYDCSTPSGTWVDHSVEEAYGGLPTDVVTPLVNTLTLADNAIALSSTEDTEHINTEKGYKKSNAINGRWSASYSDISAAYLPNYSRISFSVYIDDDNPGYFEIYTKDSDGTFKQAFATNTVGFHEVYLSLQETYFQLYCDDTLNTYTIPNNGFLFDNLKVQLADSAVFYASELKATLNSETTYKVSDKVLKDATYSKRYNDSSLSISEHHKKYAFNNASLTNYSYLYFTISSSVDGYIFITNDSTQGDLSISRGVGYLIELMKNGDNWNIYINGKIFTNYDGTNPRSNLVITDNNLSNLYFMANANCIDNPITFSPLYYENVLAAYNISPYSIVYHEDDEELLGDFADEICTTFNSATGANITAEGISSSEETVIVNTHPFSDANLSTTTESEHVHEGFTYSSIIEKTWTPTMNTQGFAVDETKYTYLKYYIKGSGSSDNAYWELYSYDISDNLFAFKVDVTTWQVIEYRKTSSGWDVYVNSTNRGSVTSLDKIGYRVNGKYYVTPLTTTAEIEPIIANNETKIVLGTTLAECKGLDVSSLDDMDYRIEYLGSAIFIYGGTDHGTHLGVIKFLNDYFDYEYYCPGVETYNARSKVFLEKEEYESNNALSDWYNVDGDLRFGDDYKSYNNHIGTAYSYTDSTLIYRMHNEASYIESDYFTGFTNNGHINLEDSTNITGVADFIYNEYALGSNKLWDKFSFSLNDDSLWYSEVSDVNDYSNQYWTFMNSVAEALDELIDYDVTLYGLAYGNTVLTPSTVGYSFYHGSHVNLSVWYAPVEANWYKPLNDDINKEDDFTNGVVTYSPYYAYVNWSNLCTDGVKMGLFSYGTYTDSYFSPFDSINSMQANYQFAASHNTNFIYDMGQYDNEVETDWAKLKIYLKQKFSINPYASQDALISDFFDNYFGAASSLMLSLFNSEREQIASCYSKNTSTSQTLKYGALHAGKINAQCYYWTKSDVLSLLSTYDSALSLVSEDTTLTNRIKLEGLAIRYIFMRGCTKNYGTEKITAIWYNSRKDSFSAIQSDAISLGVTHMGESQTFGTLS